MKASLLAVFTLLCVVAYSQQGTAPGIKWQKSLGGTATDQANAVAATADGGCVIAGFTNSNDSDVTGNHGATDYFIAKLNSSGTPQWKKVYGGTKDDQATSVQQTTDGGYIVAGHTGSTDGNVTGHHFNSSAPNNLDFWILKLDVAGNIVWKKCYGGGQDDVAKAVRQTADGGYIVTGYTESISGDVTNHKGSRDVWIVKLAADGTMQWQKDYGGSLLDYASDVKQTPDGGYIIAANTRSFDGDLKNVIHPGVSYDYAYDYWVIKLNAAGTLQWQKCYGGRYDEEAASIDNTIDSGYVVAGFTSANGTSGNVSGMHGGQDYWIVKLSKTGNLQWQRCLGGTNADVATGIRQTADKNYIVAGYTSSNNLDVSGNHGGSYDVWLTKINNYSGEIIWQKPFGGNDYDYAYAVAATNDKGYFFAGSSGAVSGDVTRHFGNPGLQDMWVVKLKPDTLGLAQTITFPAISAQMYGNGDFTLNATASSGLPVKYTSSDTAVLTIIGGNKGHIKKAGNVTITASQAGNSTYVAAAPVARALTIGKGTQGISFGLLPVHSILEDNFTLTANTTSGLPVTFTSSDTSKATIKGNIVTIKKAGYVNITASQSGDSNFQPAVPQTRVLTIGGTDISAPYALICPNTPATFTASIPNPPAGTVYQWVKNNVFVGTNSPKYTDSVPQNNEEVRVIASANGKSDTSRVFKITIITPQVTVKTNYIQICAGESLGFSASALVPAFSPQFVWKKNDTIVGSGSNYIARTLKAGDSVWATVTPTAACGQNPGLVSNKIGPKVLPIGRVSVTINYQPSNYKLCSSKDTTTITFHAVGQNGGQNPKYEWYKNQGQLVGTDSSFYVGHGFKRGDIVFCIYTSNQTCTVNNIKSVVSNYITLDTTAPLKPVVTIAQSPDTPVCYGTKVRFKTSSIYGSGSNPVYQWMKNGHAVGTNSDVYYDSLLINGDSVWCTMATDYPCATSPLAVSNKIRPRIDYALPLVPSAISGPVTVTAGQQRVGYLVNRVNDVTYLWSLPAGASFFTGQHTNQVLINWGNTGGLLIAQARNSCGYSPQSRLTVTVTPGLQGLSSDEQSTISGIASSKAQIYPNPAATNTTVSFTATQAGKYMVQVSDANGRILQVKETNAAKGRNTININVSGYAKGSYFVRLSNKDGKQQATFTLVVAK